MFPRISHLLFFTIVLAGCQSKNAPDPTIDSDATESQKISATSLLLLGTFQDAGSPQIGCTKDCCKDFFKNPDPSRKVVSLGLYDAATGKKYLFEATPDITSQMKLLTEFGESNGREIADGIFLTHAHIGHYTGLMYLGKEAMNAQNVPVYAMPRMKGFLQTSGPWSQLVETGNIQLNELENEKAVHLSENLKVTPFLVPHRDEFSETVGYRIEGPNRSALFIPDIDKWEKWEKDILAEIEKVDYAFLDATFYSGAEIGHRDISEIPHPFVIESLAKFDPLPESEKRKIVFLHFNHTNPVVKPESEAAKRVMEKGFRVGRMREVFGL